MTRLQKSALFLGVTLAIFFLYRGALFFIYHRSFQDLSYIDVVKAFGQGVRFDLSIILTFFLLPVLMMNLPTRLAENRKWLGLWSWLMYLLVIGGTLILICDLVYFGFVDRHIGRELLALTNDFGFIYSMALSSFKIELFLFSLYSAGLYLAWKYALARQTIPSGRQTGKFILLVLFLFIGIRGTVKEKSINIIDAYTSGSSSYGNLMLNGVFTSYHVIRKSNNVNYSFMEDDELYAALGLPDTQYPLLRKNPKNPGGYNLVYVLLEGWSFKYIDGFARNGYGVTPNFDAMTNEGVAFPNFFAAGQRSIGGIQAITTGLPIMPGLPYLSYGLEISRFTKLGNIFNENGYDTSFIVSSRRRSYRLDSVAQTLGFRSFYGMEDVPLVMEYPDPKAADYGWDYDTLMFAKGKIDGMNKPFFAFLFTGTTHTPYPDPGEKFHIHPHVTNTEEAYLNTLFYADWSLGEFMARCRKEPWFDNTIFVFSADHALLYFQTGDFADMFHIPLLVYAPKILEPKVIDTYGSQLDMMPTIIGLMGFDTEYSALGVSLFEKKEDYVTATAGEHVGIISGRGYLKHTLSNRLEMKGYEEGLPPEFFDGLEKTLLARYQIVYELLQSNRLVK